MSSLEADGARMVDVSGKAASVREAEARCIIGLTHETKQLIHGGGLPKGDALEVARIAGVMAAKSTPSLIPLCHPIALASVEVDFEDTQEGIEVQVVARATDRTGVEMEALTAASVAALTIYDMVKSIEPGAVIGGLRVVRKSGGRSDAAEGRG